MPPAAWQPPPGHSVRRRILGARRAAASWGELVEKPQVVLVEHSDVVDAVEPQREPFDADAERESRVTLWIVADGFEDGWMHHAAAQDLDPSGVLAERAARAVAALAFDVEFGRRLRV